MGKLGPKKVKSPGLHCIQYGFNGGKLQCNGFDGFALRRSRVSNAAKPAALRHSIESQWNSIEFSRFNGIRSLKKPGPKRCNLGAPWNAIGSQSEFRANIFQWDSLSVQAGPQTIQTLGTMTSLRNLIGIQCNSMYSMGVALWGSWVPTL